MKARTSLTVEKAILERAHQQGVNISRFLESSLKAYLEGNAQPQPQNQTIKQTNLIELFPSEAIKKLQKHGFDLTDGDWLKRIIYDSLEKCIVQLGFEVYDKRADTYVLLE